MEKIILKPSMEWKYKFIWDLRKIGCSLPRKNGLDWRGQGWSARFYYGKWELKHETLWKRLRKQLLLLNQGQGLQKEIHKRNGARWKKLRWLIYGKSVQQRHEKPW